MTTRILLSVLLALLLGGLASADVGSPAPIWATGGEPTEQSTGISMTVNPSSCPGIHSSVTEYQFKRYDNYVTGTATPAPAFTSAWQGTGGTGNTYLDIGVVAQSPATRHNYRACCRSNVPPADYTHCTQIYPLLNSGDGIGYGPPMVFFVTANRLPIPTAARTIRARSQLAIVQLYEHRLPFKYTWKWGKMSDPVESWTISAPVSENWRTFTSADGILANTWYCFLSEISDQAGNSTGYLPSWSAWPGGSLCAIDVPFRTETLRWTQAASAAEINEYEVEYGRTAPLGTVVSLGYPTPDVNGVRSKGITVQNGLTYHFALRAISDVPTPDRKSAPSNTKIRTF